MAARIAHLSTREMGGFIFGRVARRLLTLGLLAPALACGQAPRNAAGVRVVDDAGDTVAIRSSPRRIVSLIPASTELLFAIGAGGSVVGRTTWCDYPPAAAAVASLGDGISPNLEAVIGARPDLVILYNSGQNGAAAARLRDLGIPTLRLNTDLLRDVGRVARLLGRATGRERSADSLAAGFTRALEQATPSAPGRRPTVLLLVWEQPPMTLGRGSFLSELVERAGGANLFEDVATPDAPISIEAVAARDPDFILTTSDGPAAFASRPEWQAVRAVRERRFLHVSGSEFNRPSPRAPQAVRELARLIREGAG
jgi:ABC-type Fe3+-hydroxamate transport system substrate-binding protein